MAGPSSSSRIFITNLPSSLSNDGFRKHFSQQAPVTDTKFFPQRRIGYVGYKTAKDAERAVTYFNKSFVGMARLSVELARPVEELSDRAPKRRRVENQSSSLQPQSAMEADSPGGYTKASDEWAKTQPNLQEYIQIMQQPSETKTWRNQDSIMQPDSSGSVSKEEAILPVEDAEEDGYTTVPRLQKSSMPRAEMTDSELPIPPQAPTSEEQIVENDNATDLQRQDDLNSVPAAASDSDWLRSRTSRLLGLLHDDEAIEQRFSDNDDIATLSKNHRTAASDAVKISPESDSAIENREISTSKGMLPHSNPNRQDCVDIRRLFIRNLTYTATENDLQVYFESLGYGPLDEVHLPVDTRTGHNKGFAHISFRDSEAALHVLHDMDQIPFQGRLLHIMQSTERKHTAFDEFTLSKLPLKRQQQIKRKAEVASSTFNWNSLFMNADAVVSSIADRFKVSKTDLLDPTSSDAAIKQAHAETHVIQETKAFFTSQGVDLEAFKRKERGDTAILVKNFPYGTKEQDLKVLFEKEAPIVRILMPPSGTIAIVQFDQAEHTRTAFANLVGRRVKESLLFLEKAPRDLFCSNWLPSVSGNAKAAKCSSTELLQSSPMLDCFKTATLFVKNLNFSTTSQRLQESFAMLDGFRSARVKTKPDPHKLGESLSMGFGFLEFESTAQAQAAMVAMNGFKLDGHDLRVQASNRGMDAAQQRRREDQAKKVISRSTKIIIKNLPFEASKKDIRSLFGSYGKLRSVRLPRKFDSSTRGFAFADFVSAREAQNAVEALRDTHLLGRRLVLEVAAEDALDPEVEIERMQQRVSKQSDKVALQRLVAGSGRKKFAVEGGDGLDQGS